MVFIMMKKQFERDQEKYENRCRVNKENWSKWGVAKSSERVAKSSERVAKSSERYNSLEISSETPVIYDTDTDTDTDTDGNNTWIVSHETHALKNEYQENISYMRKQAEKIRNDIIPDIPDFVQESHEAEWAKFLLYWTATTKSWKILCEETKQKSFDIKRRFATWLSRVIETQKNNSKKIFIWKL